jgi:hypothetical protein
MTLRVYIGHDAREQDAYDVCVHSMRRFSSIPLDIRPLSESEPGYDRPSIMKGNQRYDERDGKPFSTEFSFARFMVPHLMDYKGWALFVDCDFLFRADVAELQRYIDPQHAVSVVHQLYTPHHQIKMDGQKQEVYSSKNWSSLILWNCGHPYNKGVTLEDVNHQSGGYLHGFSWLKPENIGSIPLEWNWLEGEYPPLPRPKAIHYTNGGPWMPNWLGVQYASDWLAEKNLMLGRKATALENNVA